MDKRGKVAEQKSVYGDHQECGHLLGMVSLCSDNGVTQDDDSLISLFSKNKSQRQSQESFFDFMPVYDPRFNHVTENQFTQGVGQCISSFVDGNINNLTNQEQSVEDILRIAAARFLKASSRKTGVETSVNFLVDESSSNLPLTEVKKIKLVELLLASAEHIENQRINLAIKLLKQCESLASKTGNPVQRLVHYFCNALQERIGAKTGRSRSKLNIGNKKKDNLCNIDRATMLPSMAVLAGFQVIPFFQILHFVAARAIVDKAIDAKIIHIIDIVIRNEFQWLFLMQALVSQHRHLGILKITAVGTTCLDLIIDIGKRLKRYARSVNLPFSFQIVMVADLLELRKDHFELEQEETKVVYCGYSLRNLLGTPDRLDSLMSVIRQINPRTMVVTEIEANNNSPNYVNRFVESLFHYSIYFDCLEACMEVDDPNRIIMETIYFGEAIRNIVVSEGEERKHRNVKIDLWRVFFDRFGMVEEMLSENAMQQANLVAKRFGCRSNCTMEMNRKSLVIGWKGTPIHSLSAWTFQSKE